MWEKLIESTYSYKYIARVHWVFFIVAHADVGCMIYQPLIDIGGSKLTYEWIRKSSFVLIF